MVGAGPRRRRAPLSGATPPIGRVGEATPANVVRRWLSIIDRCLLAESPSHEPRLRPARDRAARPGGVDGGRRLSRRRRREPAEVLRLLDAAVPERPAAHGPRAQLHHQRHAGAPPAHDRHERADADGLGRVRPAGRERGDEERRAAGEMDAREHRRDEGADAGDGPGHRLEPRDRDLRPELLQVEPVAVPEDAGGRHRRAPHPGRQLGSGRPDRARQRAGRRRPRLALGRADREARDPRLLPEDHEVRRRAARAACSSSLPGWPERVKTDAGELDRQERGRALRLPAPRSTAPMAS